MVIIWGTRLFGRVDRVPGLLYVATQFFHVMMLPLFPTGSVIVLADRATPTESISWKSVLLTWLQAVAFFFAAFFGLILLAGVSRFSAGDLSLMVGAIAVSLAILVVPSRIKPRYERACDLGRQVDLSSAEWTVLNRAYGREDGLRPGSPG